MRNLGLLLWRKEIGMRSWLPLRISGRLSYLLLLVIVVVISSRIVSVVVFYSI